MNIISMFTREQKFKNEPRQISGTVDVGSWIGEIWPVSEEYRVVLDENYSFHQLRLQAKRNGEWVEVMMYDDGKDDYGQLSAGKWSPLSEQCSWTRAGLERIARKALGQRLDPVELSRIAIQNQTQKETNA